MKERKFNQKEYINEYKKKYYSPIKINLKKDEKKELDILLSKHKLTQVQFIRNAIEELKKKDRN